MYGRAIDAERSAVLGAYLRVIVPRLEGMPTHFASVMADIIIDPLLIALDLAAAAPQRRRPIAVRRCWRARGR